MYCKSCGRFVPPSNVVRDVSFSHHYCRACFDDVWERGIRRNRRCKLECVRREFEMTGENAVVCGECVKGSRLKKG